MRQLISTSTVFNNEAFENRSDKTIEPEINMNQYDTNSEVALVDPVPLFASSWLALFSILRESFNERREQAKADKRASNTEAN